MPGGVNGPSVDGRGRSVSRRGPVHGRSTSGGEPITIAPRRPEEFAPGLDPERLELIQATAEVESAG